MGIMGATTHNLYLLSGLYKSPIFLGLTRLYMEVCNWLVSWFKAYLGLF